MNIEMPTFIDPLSLADANPKRSGNVISRKSSKLGPTLPSKSELIVGECQEAESKRVRQKGMLIERGIRNCGSNHNLQHGVGEVIGDCSLNTIRSREEFVQQRKELTSDANYAHFKGVLMEKGIRTYTDNVPKKKSNKKKNVFRKKTFAARKLVKQEREEFVRQLSSDMKPSYLKEVLFENSLIEAKDSETTEESSIDMGKIIRDINQFTANMDTNPHRIDWQKFRFNLLKIHKYYMDTLQDENPDMEVGIDPTEVDFNVENVMQPLITLIKRSKTLGNHVENKISNLDTKAEEFYAKYNQTLLNRERAFNDMMDLQSMREQIGERLSRIEMEIRESRKQLLQRGVQNK